MQESFTNYDQLPLFLNANTVAQVLGIVHLQRLASSCTRRIPRPADRQSHRGTKRKIPPVGGNADRR